MMNCHVRIEPFPLEYAHLDQRRSESKLADGNIVIQVHIELFEIVRAVTSMCLLGLNVESLLSYFLYASFYWMMTTVKLTLMYLLVDMSLREGRRLAQAVWVVVHPEI